MSSPHSLVTTFAPFPVHVEGRRWSMRFGVCDTRCIFLATVTKYSTKQEPQKSLRLVLGSSVNAQSFRSFHTTETNATQTCAVSWNTSVPFFLGIITNNLTSGNCPSIVKEENNVDTLSLFLQFHWPKLFIKHLQEIIYLSGGFTIQNFNLLNFQMKPV